ncbi:MAG: hypothetical protein LBE74_03115 [Treponema sp.]|jgi:hypothetical protein|nr:hypothetical protein [Treponema sp.]
MKNTRAYIGLVVLAVAGCNMFSADAGAYRENNPQGFRKTRLGRMELARLSFGTSSRYADQYAGESDPAAGSLHDPGCIIDVSNFDFDGNGTITMTSSNSSNNAGKIAGSEDGIAYYYKKIPKDINFRLSADFEVIIFGLSNGKADLNGQEGWGIMARDYVPQYKPTSYEPIDDNDNPGLHPGGIDMTYDAMRESQQTSNPELDKHPDGKDFVYWAGHKLPDGPGGSGNMVLVGGVKRGVRVYYRYGVKDPIGDAMYNPNTVTDASFAKFNYLPREMSDYSLYPHIRARPDYPWGTHIISSGGEEAETGLPLLKYSLSLEKTNNGFKASFDAPDDVYDTLWGKVSKGVLANNLPAQGAKVEYSDVDTKTKRAKELGGKVMQDLLFEVDEEYYYVGFFVCRDAKVRISNIQYYEADKDACAQKITDWEPEVVTPTFNVTSPAASSTAEYTFGAKSNVLGIMDLSLNGEHIKSYKGDWITEPTNASAVPFGRFEIDKLKLKDGPNVFTAVFTPLSDKPDVDEDNPDAKIEQLDDAYPVGPEGSYEVLNRSPIKKTFIVEHRKITGETIEAHASYASNSLYAAPHGRSFNKGTRDSPLDLITAINFVQPGQEVILLGGVYSFKHVEIPLYNSGLPKEGRENNGWIEKDGNVDTSADSALSRNAVMTRNYQNYKYLIADDPVNNPPILDFQCPETLKPDWSDIKGFEIRGDYWWIEGIHVRNTANKRVGLNIFGKNNVLHNVKAYWNGDSGISIAGSSSESKALWPQYNTVQFCESFANMDKSREDADGFADKLTAWVGNRFLYCVGHHNADDGWDLFSKKETGGIGAVYIYKSIAYMNGRWLQPGEDDDPNQADPENYPYWHLQNESTMSGGNGFKMGGEGIPVLHESVDCLAFLNDADGFTTNSDPAIIVSYATSYNNGKTVDPGAIRKPSNFTIYGTGTSTNIGLDAILTQVASIYALDGDDELYNTNEKADGYKGDRIVFPRHGDYAEAKSTASGYLWYAATSDENGWSPSFAPNGLYKTPADFAPPNEARNDGSFNLSGRKLTIDNVENPIPPFTNWNNNYTGPAQMGDGGLYIPSKGDGEGTAKANTLRGESTWSFYDNNGILTRFKGAFLEFDVEAASAMASQDVPSEASCAYYKLKDFMKLKGVSGSTPGARDLW